MDLKVSAAGHEWVNAAARCIQMQAFAEGFAGEPASGLSGPVLAQGAKTGRRARLFVACHQFPQSWDSLVFCSSRVGARDYDVKEPMGKS